MMIKKIRNSKFKIRNWNAGMTYVELIVVLSIFSVLGSAVMFNYGTFQDRVDVRNLANDVALRIIEAQKSSISGKLPPSPLPSASWRPSYGIYIDRASDDKSFNYFVDRDQGSDYDTSSCPGNGDCLEKVTITKGNYISQINRYSGSTPTAINTPLSITFIRPNNTAIFYSSGSLLTGFDYIQITIRSPKGHEAYIKVYPSGRIQIN